MVNKVKRIQQYRHICLLNVCFKIFTKVTTMRLNTVADHVVHFFFHTSHTTFIQGRSILDGVVYCMK
jgi:hypothetical protein